jgi:hypothetical protein
VPATSNEREKEEHKPKLQSDGAGARDGGKGTRNGAGESGHDQSHPDYKPGQNITCTVIQAQRNGYLVSVPATGERGFYGTNAQLNPNETILAQYICRHSGRVMLAPIYDKSKRGPIMLAKEFSSIKMLRRRQLKVPKTKLLAWLQKRSQLKDGTNKVS